MLIPFRPLPTPAALGRALPGVLLLLLLVAPLLLRAEYPIPDTDYQDGNTLILRVTDSYLALLKEADEQVRRGVFAGSPGEQQMVQRLYDFRQVLLRPYPVDPFDYLLFGRLTAPQPITDPGVLLPTLRGLSVKAAMKKALPAPAAPGQAGPDLDALAVAAENERWALEFKARLDLDQGFRARFANLFDPLHPNSMSRWPRR